MLVHANRFDGNTLHIAGIRVDILNPASMPSSNPVFIEQAQADQEFSGAWTLGVRNLALSVRITDYANRHALAQQVKAWFKPGRRGALEATFLDDGREYQVDGVVVSITPDKDFVNIYTVILQTGDSAWRAVDADTENWIVSGTGGTKEIVVDGNDETLLSLDITPTAAPAARYLYQRLYRLVNVPLVEYGVRPWCLTIDHAALVSAGKSQADGDDLRIWLGDSETKRWIAGANTAACKIWFNLAIPAGYNLPLLTAIPSSGDISVIQFQKTTNVANALKALPASGVVYHGNEWFFYAARDPAKYQMTGITRKAYGTSEEAHSVNDVLKFIAQPVFLMYGNASVGNPADNDSTYDDDKPLFNLADSDNTKWVYDATTKFYDPDHPGRPGEWKQYVKRNALNQNAYLYRIKGNDETGDPALGARGANYMQGTTSRSDSLELAWSLYCAGTFSVVSATGRKFRSGTLFLAKCAFQRSATGTSWIDLWNETSPTAVETWQNWSAHSSVAVAAGSKYIRFVFGGTFAATPANSYAMGEALTVTVEFTSANLPTAALLSEATNCQLTADIANDANGDTISIDLPLLPNKLLAIDGEARSAIYDGANVHRSIVIDDEGRPAWIRLPAGNNTISITGADLGTLDVDLKWFVRRLH